MLDVAAANVDADVNADGVAADDDDVGCHE